MKIAVLANDEQWEEMIKDGAGSNCIRINHPETFPEYADAFLLLKEPTNFDFKITTKPVLINAVCSTLSKMKAPANVTRINGWNSFLSASKWEIAGSVTEPVKQIFCSLGKEAIIVSDEEGFVSARIVSMIINEAYFALGEKISTKKEMDIAMKLGTNYPYGPFEWASVIGINNIYTLLQKLYPGNPRYRPAPLLILEATI